MENLEKTTCPVSDSISAQLEKTTCPLSVSSDAKPEKITAAPTKEDQVISEAKLVDIAPLKEEHVIHVDDLVEAAKPREMVKEVVIEKAHEPEKVDNGTNCSC
ncbi:hypothetical protein QQ045_027678 [Rhodiola kirilowii]